VFQSNIFLIDTKTSTSSFLKEKKKNTFLNECHAYL